LDVLSFVVESYPDACSASDTNGKLLVHYACQFEGVTEAFFDVILSVNPEGAHVIDSLGNLPIDIDYANSNPNKVTKEAVLIAFNESKVCTQVYALAVPNELSCVICNAESKDSPSCLSKKLFKAKKWNDIVHYIQKK
jgi:hypothetical protein